MAKPLRVLVVEDSEADAELEMRQLRKGGFDPEWLRVETADAMKTALDGQDWDVVISDYVLPSFGGLEALCVTQEHKPDTPFIMMSGKIGEDVAVDSVKAGARDYVMKDNLGRLTPAVERAIRDAEEHRSRRETEEALLHSERLFRTIVETAMEGVWRYDSEFITIYVNQHMADMLGCSVEEMTGVRALEFFAEESKALAQANYERRKLGISSHERYELRRKDGTTLWTSFAVSPMLDAEGRFAGSLGMVTDITQQLQWEEALAEHVRQQTAVAALGLRALGGAGLRELMDDAVSVVAECLDVEYVKVLELDAEGRSLLLRAGVGWHEGMVGSATVGAGLDSQAGYTLSVNKPVIVDDLRTETRFRSPKLLTDHGVVSGVSVVIRGNTRPFGVMGAHTTTHRAFSADAAGFLQAVANVLANAIQRKRAEEELARSNAELEQFAYVASHDLQEPLRAIENYVELIARRYQGKLDSNADEFIGFVVEGATRMRALISDLLQYSRASRQGGSQAMVESRRAAETAIGNLSAALSENGVEVRLGDMPTVWAEESQLVRVFQNLIGNAAKFHGDEAPRVDISARKEGNDWIFSVSDNGIGIAPENHDRIFQVFEHLHSKDEYPGSGIGLAICRRIVERRGGRIWVESRLGEGSTFHFTLAEGGLEEH